MSAEALAVLQAYVDLWSEPDATRRAALLDRCWREDSEIIGPGYHFRGRQAVLDEAARHLANPAGHRALRRSGFDLHSGWARFTIAVVDAQGLVLQEGWDVVAFAADGRIAQVITFWGELPPAS